MRPNYYELPSSLLESRKPPWKVFAASLSLQSLAVLLLLGVPLLFPETIEPLRNYRLTLLVPVPELPPPKPRPRPVTPAEMARAESWRPAIEPPVERRILAPKFTSPIARPKVKPLTVENAEAPQLAAVSQALDPRLLSGSSATPTLRRPRPEVQTGGFGDPHGVPASAYTGGTPNIAPLGSFDLPPGPGYGNGTGGARGQRGVVASAGFGRGVAVGGSGAGSGAGTVQTGAFGDQPPVAASSAPTPRRSEPEGKLEPVEILVKPRPAYTDAARAAKIEGEVLVEVLFTAAGEVVVQRIIRGLGYGLDESALAAARNIKFRPARRGGQPVDVVGVVHIIFRLAE
ncbi:MAG: energy transducer TonB [Firmicutes bacterium]|nr:energy transducer TonB [Bacillota bacterium]